MRAAALLLALAASPSIHVSPDTVKAGGRVVVSGSAAGCPSGDRVTLLSRGFARRHEFAGVPAVYARVARNGRFGHGVTIPRTTPAGRYTISGRCGGGNLGVTARLVVTKR